MATIKDVAKLAGVSASTVSRIMNNRGDFTSKVRAKVTAAMIKLDYHPNELARSLQSQRSHILGVIIPSSGNPFYGEVARCIETHAYKYEYKIMICNSLHEKNKEQEYITLLKRNQVDGIIMASHLMNTGDYLDLNLPLISLDRQLGPDIPFISSNNYLGGKLATGHLIERGCRNLVHISGDMKIKKLSNERLTAFLDVCKAAKVTFRHLELPDRFVVDYNDEGKISNFFDIYPDCDGIFAGNDFIAMAVIGIAAKHGKKIPEDLRIIGYDDDFFAPMLNPSLSTIRQPTEAIGRYAVEYLVRMAEGEEVPTQTILPVQLITRQSTK